MKKNFSAEEFNLKQEELEGLMFGNGIERFNVNNKRAIEQGEASATAWFRRLTKLFIEPYAEAIQAYIDYYSNRAGKPARALAYLRMLPPETSAYVALKVIFDSLPIDGLSAQMVAEKIGRRIEDQVRFTKLEGCAPQYIKAIKAGIAKAKTQSYEHKLNVLTHAEKKLAESKDSRFVNDVNRWTDWPKTDSVQLGARLIDIFQESVQYKGEPVIKKEVKDLARGKGNKSVCYLLPTETICDWIGEFKEAVSQLSPCYAPCVVPPRDWASPFAGGFHTIEVSSKLKLVKCDSMSHLKRLTRKQMPAVYDAVNMLQSVRWQVSDEILEVASAILEGDMAIGMASAEPLRVRPAPVPVELQHLRGKELREALTPSQWDNFCEWKSEAAEIYDAERERRGKYLEAVRTIGQANTYSSFENIYFVYTLDFRGRIYCQSSLLSPQGGDLQKGLIRFSEQVPLGKEGKYWLAVHGANVWGEDKLTFSERVKFTESIEEDIQDYAANPLLFKGWNNADSPFQFLAFCKEWARLLEWEAAGNSAETFLSNLPIAMDGSCSGIQHYSALLRDDVGGAAVNLTPSERPQDIYAEVAKEAIRKLAGIIKEPETEEQIRDLAQAWLDLGVTRGITKKSVMTLPYGSTQLTCRESVAEYLAGLVKKEASSAKAEGRPVQRAHPFSQDKADPLNKFEAEKLLSSVIWDAIGSVVIAARQGMDFIKQVTKAVAKEGHALEWVTPTGFIVEQAVYEMEASRVDTQLMGRTQFVLLEPTDVIDTRKMQSGCAPNYIHSYDASHLTLVVCDAKDKGISSIACIHDSFGAHAGRTAELRASLTGTFVKMYSEKNWLQDFKEVNEARLLKEIDVPVPEYLGLDLNLVLQSQYCFA